MSSEGESKVGGKQEIVSVTYEEIGLFPRSFSRVLDRFLKQVFSDVDNLVIQEYRFYRYLFLTTVRCLFILFFVPFLVNFVAKNYLIHPLTEYYWNTKQTEIFLNSYQQKRAFSELKEFEEKLYFESLIYSKTAPQKSFSSIYNDHSLDNSTLKVGLESSVNDLSAQANLSSLALQAQSGKMDSLGLSTELSFPQGGTKSSGLVGPTGPESLNGVTVSPRDLGVPPMESPNFVPPLGATPLVPGAPRGPWRGALPLALAQGDTGFLGASSKVGNSVPPKLGQTIGLPPTESPRVGQTIGLPPTESPRVGQTIGLPPKPGGLSNRDKGLLMNSSTPQSVNTTNVVADTKGDSGVSPLGLVPYAPNSVTSPANKLIYNTLSYSIEPYKKLQEKTIEIATRYNNQSIEAITNFFADCASLITLLYLLFVLEIQINITKSFLLEVFFGLDDSKKSLFILLITDLLVGYHSSNIWELFFEFLFNHYGLPESQTGIFLLVATLPVLLDVLFKYLIFRHLNRSSPATVATYHAMIE